MKLMQINIIYDMKRLKLFEDFDESLKVGDYIVLLHPDFSDLDMGFKKDEIYEIINIDKSKVPYKLANETKFTWVTLDQVRKASSEEINANKYNI